MFDANNLLGIHTGSDRVLNCNPVLPTLRSVPYLVTGSGPIRGDPRAISKKQKLGFCHPASIPTQNTSINPPPIAIRISFLPRVSARRRRSERERGNGLEQILTPLFLFLRKATHLCSLIAYLRSLSLIPDACFPNRSSRLVRLPNIWLRHLGPYDIVSTLLSFDHVGSV